MKIVIAILITCKNLLKGCYICVSYSSVNLAFKIEIFAPKFKSFIGSYDGS